MGFDAAYRAGTYPEDIGAETALLLDPKGRAKHAMLVGLEVKTWGLSEAGRVRGEERRV